VLKLRRKAKNQWRAIWKIRGAVEWYRQQRTHQPKTAQQVLGGSLENNNRETKASSGSGRKGRGKKKVRGLQPGKTKVKKKMGTNEGAPVS